MPGQSKERTRNGRKAKRGRGLALLFPGQGSQRVAMGRDLAATSRAARDVYDQADNALGFPISRVCFEASAKELDQTANTQPAVLATSIAHLASVRERLAEIGRRLRPSFVAGHSLGQFSAAVGAGSLDLSDALRLVQERARIMADWAKSRPGGLAAVIGPTEPEVRQACEEVAGDGSVGVAGVNAPGQTVIAGDVGALQQAIALLRERGGRVLRLPISVPGHLPVMQDAARELGRFIENVPFKEPETPIVSNISGRIITTAGGVREELTGQLCSAVEWARCVMTMANGGASTFVEVGPGRALSNLVRRIQSEAEVLSLDDARPADLLALGATAPLVNPASSTASGRRRPRQPVSR